MNYLNQIIDCKVIDPRKTGDLFSWLDAMVSQHHELKCIWLPIGVLLFVWFLINLMNEALPLFVLVVL